MRLRQRLPLQLAQNASLVADARDHTVIHPEEKEHADIFKARPLDVTDQHLIKARRDHRHLRRLKTGFEHINIFIQRQNLFAKQSHQLVKQIHDDPPDPPVLLTAPQIKCRHHVIERPRARKRRRIPCHHIHVGI